MHLSSPHTYHFLQERIKAALPTRRPFVCPDSGCNVEGKDWQALMRHYTGKHGILESYLKEVIAQGLVNKAYRENMKKPRVSALNPVLDDYILSGGGGGSDIGTSGGGSDKENSTSPVATLAAAKRPTRVQKRDQKRKKRPSEASSNNDSSSSSSGGKPLLCLFHLQLSRKSIVRIMSHTHQSIHILHF